MLSTFPASLNCWFNGFPEQILITCGSAFETVGGPEKTGTKLVLTQTTDSMVPQSEYVEGNALPDVAAIYTDTGDDDTFQMKVKMAGHGTFFAGAEDNYWLEILKTISIQTAELEEKIFEKKTYAYTQIPTSTEITGVDAGDDGWYYGDPVVPTSPVVAANEAWLAANFLANYALQLGLPSDINEVTVTSSDYNLSYVSSAWLAIYREIAQFSLLGNTYKLYFLNSSLIVLLAYHNSYSGGTVTQTLSAARAWADIKVDGVSYWDDLVAIV
jgi:hypothetical protein